MKIFNFKDVVIKLNANPSVISIIEELEFYRGKVYNLPNKIKLNRLHDISKRRSVTSSNEIEGIKISKKQEKEIFDRKSSPETDEEKMLLGYNFALEHIFEVYKYQELDEEFIKYLSELEWKLINPSFGRNYKDHQNYIREYFNDGTSRTVFIPTKPQDTAQTLGNLIYQFNDSLSDYRVNRLIAIFVFILDFLCIHPFNDGNGRVSRLLTTYLLLKYGYELDRYYSTSYLILQNLNGYYDSLEKSSIDWNIDNNDYSYFVIYMLSIILEGYKKIDYILSISNMKGAIEDKLLLIIKDAKKPLSKNDIEEILFNYKRDYIEEGLGKLIKNNKIQLLQKGKYSLYWKI